MCAQHALTLQQPDTRGHCVIIDILAHSVVRKTRNIAANVGKISDDNTANETRTLGVY